MHRGAAWASSAAAGRADYACERRPHMDFEDRRGQKCRRFARRAAVHQDFRANLIKLTNGKVPGADAHHVFLQKFAAQFSKFGIDIDDRSTAPWLFRRKDMNVFAELFMVNEGFVRGAARATETVDVVGMRAVELSTGRWVPERTLQLEQYEGTKRLGTTAKMFVTRKVKDVLERIRANNFDFKNLKDATRVSLAM